jgi:hypothetical protein
MQLSARRIVLSLQVTVDVPAERTAVVGDALIEELGGGEPPPVLEDVDAADEFAAKQEQALQVTAHAGGGELLHITRSP